MMFYVADEIFQLVVKSCLTRAHVVRWAGYNGIKKCTNWTVFGPQFLFWHEIKQQKGR